MKYLSEDGKIFNEEYACKIYEKKLTEKNLFSQQQGMVFLDDSRREITVKDIAENVDCVDDIQFAAFATAMDSKTLSDYVEEFGTPSSLAQLPPQGAVGAWMYYRNEWSPCNCIKEDAKQILKEIEYFEDVVFCKK